MHIHLSILAFNTQNALKQRQRALTLSEEEHASAAASSFRRTAASSSGAAQPDRDLDTATPELASALKKRQEQAELARRHSESEAHSDQEAHAPGRGGVVSADGARGSAGLGWSNANAPFGGELASVLLKRWALQAWCTAAAAT